jgi:hypothetical protein
VNPTSNDPPKKLVASGVQRRPNCARTLATKMSKEEKLAALKRMEAE